MPVKSNLRGAILLGCLLGISALGKSAPFVGQAPRQPADAADSLVANADAAYQAGRFDEARRWLEQAIRNEPGSAHARALLGLVLARQNDAPGALQNLRQAYELEPHNSDYAYNYAVLLLQNGQYRGGKATRRARAKRWPGSPASKRASRIPRVASLPPGCGEYVAARLLHRRRREAASKFIHDRVGTGSSKERE